jgi:hypothetical protein
MIPLEKGRMHDSPAEFDILLPAKQAALLAWIAYAMKPASTFGRHDSYTIKHAAEEALGFYVTNGEFKGAMLAAGHEPKDRDEQNWTFKVRPLRRGRGIASTYAEALGYVRRERAA